MLGTNDRIAQWLAIWDDTASDPASILFDDVFATIVAALVGSRDNSRYHADLVQRLRSRLRDPDDGLTFVDGRFPALVAALAVSCPTVGSVDPVALRTALTSIAAVLTNSREIVEALADSLLGAATALPERLRTLSLLLARALLPLEDRLPDLPRDCLGRYAIKTGLAEAVREIAQNPTARPAVVKAIRRASLTGATAPYLTLETSSLERLPFRYRLVRQIAVEVADEMFTGSSISSSLLSIQAQLAERIGHRCLCAAVDHAICHGINLLSVPYVPNTAPPEAVEYGAAVSDAASDLETWIAAVPDVAFARVVASPHRYIGEALARRIRDHVMKLAIDRFRLAVPSALCTDIGRQLIETLASLDPSIALDVAALRRWAARADVHEIIRHAVGTQSASIRQSLREAYQSVADLGGIISDETSDRERFWFSWLHSFADGMSSSVKEVWAIADWDVVSSTDVEGALSELWSGSDRKREYDVSLTTHGITPDQQVWTMGSGLLCYDSAVVDPGEAALFGQPAAADALRTWVTVEAPTLSAARRQAVADVEAATTVLSHSLSAGLEFGYRFDLLPRAYLADAATGDDQFRSEARREQWTEPVSAGNRTVRAVWEGFDPLLARYSNRTRRTLLDTVLLRTLAWYRSGRWDPNVTTRFLAQYVALEHVFVGGKIGAKSEFPHLAPKVLISWVDVPEAKFGATYQDVFKVALSLREVALTDADLGRQLDSIKKLRGWRLGVRPLLTTSAMAALAARSRGATAFVNLRDALIELANSDGPRAEWESRERERLSFQLLLFSARRNEIVHDAVHAADDMDYFALALDRVAEKLIDRLIRLTYTDPPVAVSIPGLFRWHEAPWLK
jgi:hypothetical protein